MAKLRSFYYVQNALHMASVLLLPNVNWMNNEIKISVERLFVDSANDTLCHSGDQGIIL